MQRPGIRSTRGARYLFQQNYEPEIDQVADIAALNALKLVGIQHDRESQVHAAMAKRDFQP